jgi:hypothetical protein
LSQPSLKLANREAGRRSRQSQRRASGKHLRS